REGDPLVCIGGPCASNPEPLAPFVDFALIGDAEDAIGEILETVGQSGWRAGGKTDSQKLRRPDGQLSRAELMEGLASIPGVYVPSLYELSPGSRRAIPKASAPSWTASPVVARKVPVLRPEDHPRRMVVSLTETTHDRLPIEVMRGCMRGCRFCQA